MQVSPSWKAATTDNRFGTTVSRAVTGRSKTITTQPLDVHSLIHDHKSFAVLCPLALIGCALYPALVHRLMASIHASSPHSVALMQLRFTSFAVASLRRDFLPQDCAHAGRPQKRATEVALFLWSDRT